LDERLIRCIAAIPNLNEMWEPYPGNRAKICPKWNKALVFRHSFAREGIHSSKIPPDLELLGVLTSELICVILTASFGGITNKRHPMKGGGDVNGK
jgi:hypothetical protein